MAEDDPNLGSRRNYPAYDEDFAAWLNAQATLLSEHRFAELDIEHLVDEVEGLAKSNFRAFVSAIRLVIFHMMKWDYQPALRSRSWRTSIHTHRLQIEELLEENPSYRARIGEAVARAYAQVPAAMESETAIPTERLPAACPYDWQEILDRLHDFDADRAWPARS